MVDEEESPDEIEFVNTEGTPKKKRSKKKSKKKTSKKKASRKKTKKKVSKAKKRKVKALEPVGEKKLPKVAMDAAIELDSRGRPLGDSGSDHLKHLIGEDTSEDIGFADDEQALKRYNDRTDMD